MNGYQLTPGNRCAVWFYEAIQSRAPLVFLALWTQLIRYHDKLCKCTRSVFLFFYRYGKGVVHTFMILWRSFKMLSPSWLYRQQYQNFCGGKRTFTQRSFVSGRSLFLAIPLDHFAQRGILTDSAQLPKSVTVKSVRYMYETIFSHARFHFIASMAFFYFVHFYIIFLGFTCLCLAHLLFIFIDNEDSSWWGWRFTMVTIISAWWKDGRDGSFTIDCGRGAGSAAVCRKQSFQHHQDTFHPAASLSTLHFFNAPTCSFLFRSSSSTNFLKFTFTFTRRVHSSPL